MLEAYGFRVGLVVISRRRDRKQRDFSVKLAHECAADNMPDFLPTDNRGWFFSTERKSWPDAAPYFFHFGTRKNRNENTDTKHQVPGNRGVETC